MTNQNMQAGGQGGDIDPQETREWLDALQALIEREASSAPTASSSNWWTPPGGPVPTCLTKPPRLRQHHSGGTPSPFPRRPGPGKPPARLHALERMAMVVRANRENTEFGGHIASFASIATLYEVAFNHFFHAPSESHGGDLVFFQGHAAPGIYARAFLEGRLTEEQLINFRRECGGPGQGLSSYPHPG